MYARFPCTLSFVLEKKGMLAALSRGEGGFHLTMHLVLPRELGRGLQTCNCPDVQPWGCTRIVVALYTRATLLEGLPLLCRAL